MGRALWLHGRHDQSVEELERAVQLSPNFALGHYTLAFVHSLTGDPDTAVAASGHSLRLSPYDPMVFGMLGARAMALVRLNRFEEAAEAGTKAASRPNAHAHILAIAAISLALAGRLDEARAHVAAIRKTLPAYRVDDLVTAMQPAPDGEACSGRARNGSASRDSEAGTLRGVRAERDCDGWTTATRRSAHSRPHRLLRQEMRNGRIRFKGLRVPR